MDNVRESKEYATLLQEHEVLKAEHKRLESQPYDRDVHDGFRHRLIEHNQRLHDFIARHFRKRKAATLKTGSQGKRRRSVISASKAKKSARWNRRQR